MKTIPLKTLIETLEALKAAEDFFDKADGQSVLWAKTMKARVSVEYYLSMALEGQVVEVQS